MAGRRSDTPPPGTGNSEVDVLRGFLDYLRNSIAVKVEHAPEPEVRTVGVPSGTNLLGLLNHLTHVERSTFLGDEVTDWQATFTAEPDDRVADVVARYRQAVSDANEVLDACTDLAAPLRLRARGGPAACWALTHDRGDRAARRSRRHPPGTHRRHHGPMRLGHHPSVPMARSTCRSEELNDRDRGPSGRGGDPPSARVLAG